LYLAQYQSKRFREYLLTVRLEDLRYEFTIIGVRKLSYKTDPILIAVTAILDGLVVGEGLIPRLLLQPVR
jgi:hypothetical protein